MVMRGKTGIPWTDGSGSLRVGVEKAGHLLDGEEWREFPDANQT